MSHQCSIKTFNVCSILSMSGTTDISPDISSRPIGHLRWVYNVSSMEHNSLSDSPRGAMAMATVVLVLVCFALYLVQSCLYLEFVDVGDTDSPSLINSDVSSSTLVFTDSSKQPASIMKIYCHRKVSAGASSADIASVINEDGLVVLLLTDLPSAPFPEIRSAFDGLNTRPDLAARLNKA